MPQNPYLVTRLEAIRASLLAHHGGGSALAGASRGTEREAFVRDYLEALFPPGFRFGSGTVTDRDGKQSGQLDIVVEFPFLPSYPMPGGRERLYLAESVAVVLEVKSDLSAQWHQVQDSVGRLRPLRRRWESSTRLEGGNIAAYGPSESRIPYLAVGFTGYKTLEALAARLDTTPEDSRPDGALVIESGVYFGPSAKAYGSVGLFALSFEIKNYILAMTSANTDLAPYVSAQKE